MGIQAYQQGYGGDEEIRGIRLFGSSVLKLGLYFSCTIEVELSCPHWQSKLEKKRSKALEKLQKRISTTKAEAHKKSAKVRRETIEKIAAISQVSSKALATKNSLWIKLTRLS